MSTVRTAESAEKTELSSKKNESKSSGSITSLVICIGGIYASFLTWAVLQERISTTPYGPDGRVFRASLVINTIQSILTAIIGFGYLSYKRISDSERYSGPIFPSRKVTFQYALIAAAQSLSAFTAYSSLKHVDFLTLLLAKSCKLLPVMVLHITLYRRRFPAYKYMVVLVVTFGVCLFSIFHGKKSSNSSPDSQVYGMFLLVINLFLDGFYNTTQDDMFHNNKTLTGPHMMCGLSLMQTVLTSLTLMSPFNSQLPEATAFISDHPQVLHDILSFSICGAGGQLFIYYALENYGSLVLVTVTVTRKMFSMLLSVIWFKHKLSTGQWLGVLAVFGGIGAESIIKYRQGKKKSG